MSKLNSARKHKTKNEVALAIVQVSMEKKGSFLFLVRCIAIDYLNLYWLQCNNFQDDFLVQVIIVAGV